MIRTVLVFLPAALLFAYVYALIAEDLSFLKEYQAESIFTFILGQIIIIVAYFRNIRLLFILILTALLYFLISQLRFAISPAEFDTFKLTLWYRLLFTVLIIAYLSTYIILRYRWGSLVYALVSVLIAIPYIISQEAMDSSGYLMLFSVLLLLAVAVVLFSDLRFRKNLSQKQVRRFFAYGVLAMLLITLIIIMIGQGSKLQIEQIDDIQKGFSDSSLVKNVDGKVSVNKIMKPGGSNTNSNQLLMVANIENYFEDGFTPNPLYLTAYHYSLFDSAEQQFMVDSLAPDEDVYRPNTGLLPLTFTEIDSAIFSEADKYLDRHVVKMTLYNVGLALDEFVAPYTAYSVTRNPLTPDQAREYASSYTTYSLVSDWNSAYFIYNPYNAPADLIEFQQNRFETLQKHNDFKGVSPSFLRYYTLMPSGGKYDEIKNLANELVRKSKAETTIDKVLAVRDYYLSKNPIGENLFEYTDNPGVPGVPDANLLHDFLFNTHKGYCAYFAGAGLFLLRAMSVPSRLSVGFMTVDRSDKNPGWYWYYQNQAHAWVQVYFPDIGWVDFDYTIGNDQAREASQADGTPPVIPEEPEFTALAVVKKVDKESPSITASPISLTLYGDTIPWDNTDLMADLKYSEIYRDSVLLDIGSISTNDTVVLLTQDIQVIKPRQVKDEENLIMSHETIHPDRVYIWMHEGEADLKETSENVTSTPNSLIRVLVSILIALTMLLIFLPSGFLVYLFLRNIFVSDYKKHAYYNNTAMLYVLSQIGLNRKDQSNLDFAQQVVDPKYSLDYTSFVREYLKLKYNIYYRPSYEKAMSYNKYFKQKFPIFLRAITSKEMANLFFNIPRALNFILKYFYKS